MTANHISHPDSFTAPFIVNIRTEITKDKGQTIQTVTICIANKGVPILPVLRQALRTKPQYKGYKIHDWHLDLQT